MSIRDLQDSQQPMQVQQLRVRILDIEDQLKEVTPALPSILIDIHKMLAQHEELVHLLDDEDISNLHQAHEKYKHFALIAKEVKTVTAGARKKLTKNDMDNL